MPRRAFLAAVVLLVVLTGTATAALLWRNATTYPTIETQLRNRINAEHYRVCGRYLTPDVRLKWISRYRAADMVLNGYFAHRNPWSDRRVFDYYRRAGVSYSRAAEIIAWNSYPDDVTAKTAFNQFMGSASHRDAIRACAYTRIGVGNFKAGSKRMHVVEFIRP